jgi:hypothetical protein
MQPLTIEECNLQMDEEDKGEKMATVIPSVAARGGGQFFFSLLDPTALTFVAHRLHSEHFVHI